MKNVIPGHFKAFTLWFVIYIIVVAYFLSHKLGLAIGLGLVLLGSFPGDQATHLAQENHQDADTTPIEKFFQKRRKLSYLISLLITFMSLVIISASLN